MIVLLKIRSSTVSKDSVLSRTRCKYRYMNDSTDLYRNGGLSARSIFIPNQNRNRVEHCIISIECTCYMSFDARFHPSLMQSRNSIKRKHTHFTAMRFENICIFSFDLWNCVRFIRKQWTQPERRGRLKSLVGWKFNFFFLFNTPKALHEPASLYTKIEFNVHTNKWLLLFVWLSFLRSPVPLKVTLTLIFDMRSIDHFINIITRMWSSNRIAFVSVYGWFGNRVASRACRCVSVHIQMYEAHRIAHHMLESIEWQLPPIHMHRAEAKYSWTRSHTHTHTHGIHPHTHTRGARTFCHTNIVAMASAYSPDVCILRPPHSAARKNSWFFQEYGRSNDRMKCHQKFERWRNVNAPCGFSSACTICIWFSVFSVRPHYVSRTICTKCALFGYIKLPKIKKIVHFPPSDCKYWSWLKLSW